MDLITRAYYYMCNTLPLLKETKENKRNRKEKYLQTKITVIMKHSVNVNVHLTGLRECTMFIT